MSNFVESESYVLPSQVKKDVANRLKKNQGVSSLEMSLKGDAMEGAGDFSRLLLALRRQGVKISHEFSIKLDFPKKISREKTLEFMDLLPKPKNGAIKVKIYLNEGE